MTMQNEAKEPELNDAVSGRVDRLVSPALIRAAHLKWVDEHKFLPEHTKHEMKQIVAAHHQLIMTTLGAVELAYRRTLKD